MGEAVTCHYEPASEGEKDKRIAALEAELVALRSRLEFTSCLKADVEAQVLALEEQNAALRQDAALREDAEDAEMGRAFTSLAGSTFKVLVESGCVAIYQYDDFAGGWQLLSAEKDFRTAALVAAGLIEEGDENVGIRQQRKGL